MQEIRKFIHSAAKYFFERNGMNFVSYKRERSETAILFSLSLARFIHFAV